MKTSKTLTTFSFLAALFFFQSCGNDTPQKPKSPEKKAVTCIFPSPTPNDLEGIWKFDTVTTDRKEPEIEFLKESISSSSASNSSSPVDVLIAIGKKEGQTNSAKGFLHLYRLDEKTREPVCKINIPIDFKYCCERMLKLTLNPGKEESSESHPNCSQKYFKKELKDLVDLTLTAFRAKEKGKNTFHFSYIGQEVKLSGPYNPDASKRDTHFELTRIEQK
jgi:hypothetical protein